MEKEFEMTDLGMLAYFLGIELESRKNGIFMHQKKYASDVLKRFKMQECNGTSTPSKSGYMEKPRTSHYMTTKKILRYIKETIELGLLYPTNLNEDEGELVGFTDVDWCGDIDDRKSTTSYVFTINNSPISWYSRKQSIVVLSTCKAEYVAASIGACQAV
ncbi:secreted RxLR effector protein 161-like [Cicer arietinum]|uniref:secreted RxLR effector protein 161-like n=1 Tax=Cicer arietinum TaxID=3827 RepID=UPI003CC518F6